MPDDDGEFTLTADGATFTLAAGDTYLFGDDVTAFAISRIDPDLMLDPTDPTAFAVAVSLKDFTALSAFVTQRPDTIDPGNTAVPLPAPIILIGAGLLSLAGVRRTMARRA